MSVRNEVSHYTGSGVIDFHIAKTEKDARNIIAKNEQNSLKPNLMKSRKNAWKSHYSVYSVLYL